MGCGGSKQQLEVVPGEASPNDRARSAASAPTAHPSPPASVQGEHTGSVASDVADFRGVAVNSVQLSLCSVAPDAREVAVPRLRLVGCQVDSAGQPVGDTQVLQFGAGAGQCAVQSAMLAGGSTSAAGLLADYAPSSAEDDDACAGVMLIPVYGNASGLPVSVLLEFASPIWLEAVGLHLPLLQTGSWSHSAEDAADEEGSPGQVPPHPAQWALSVPTAAGGWAVAADSGSAAAKDPDDAALALATESPQRQPGLVVPSGWLAVSRVCAPVPAKLDLGSAGTHAVVDRFWMLAAPDLASDGADDVDQASLAAMATSWLRLASNGEAQLFHGSARMLCRGAWALAPKSGAAEALSIALAIPVEAGELFNTSAVEDPAAAPLPDDEAGGTTGWTFDATFESGESGCLAWRAAGPDSLVLLVPPSGATQTSACKANLAAGLRAAASSRSDT